MEENILYLLALSEIKGIGPVSIKNLIAFCGSAKAIFSTPKGQLLRVSGVGKSATQLLDSVSNLKSAEKRLAECQRMGITVLPFTDPQYPYYLKFIHQAPVILYKKGDLDFNSRPAIAMVGTRKPTHEGMDVAEEFATYFAQQGINVVSGLAYGIDIQSHRAVLNAQGYTTAVLGHGLDRIYPWAHQSKAQEICEKGALLSEYPPGTEPDPAHFPARNRIVAGMSRAVIVIEAAERGGALITAQMAFDQNREVYAVPGRIKDSRSVGCNHLIRDQIAKLITHPQEVLDDLEIQWKAQEVPNEPSQLQLNLGESLSSQETQILNILSKGETQVDFLTKQSGIPLQNLHPLLLSMEFKGLIVQSPGKRFRMR